MIELLVISGLGWVCYRYEAVGAAFRLLLFIVSVLGLLILLKIGFVTAFLTAALSIPVNLISGVFGLFYHLLLG